MGFFVLVPELEKMSTNYEFFMEHEGQDQIASHALGELSEPFKLQEIIYQNVERIDGDVFTIFTQVKGERLDTDEVIFDFVQRYNVDRTTRLHVDKDDTLLFSFPPNVQPRDYIFFHPLVFDKATLVFESVETRSGLEVYKFVAQVFNDDVSEAFPQFSPHTIKSDTVSTLWIEPITGNLVSFEKHWIDYLEEDGEQKNTVELGWKKTTQYSEYILINATESEINFIVFYKTLIPIFITIIITAIAVSVISRQRLSIVNEQMAEQEKLVTIGQLAARVAHDLRNPLTVVKGISELNKIKPSNDADVTKKRNEQLERAIGRMTHQIDNVMNFIKLKPLELETVNIKQLILITISNIEIPKNIHVNIESKDVSIVCDSKYLEVVLINIIFNAIQALDEEGTITIRASKSNGNVIIEIEDSGPGVPKSIQDKIFDPLFTTKQQGTGLGLVSCKNIIEKHGGTITVSNNPSRFIITIPDNLGDTK